ncbi:MAG TPA: helix-turn-helix domain-containing protein [Patescibacteria group bacterium]|jgi:sugar-specific transcriptional regulator TrmB|nr:helix-turn-helix domain-containing protein [Patescibacteria group bacterium]
MQDGLVNNLMRIGFTEYQAKAYIALTRKNPVTGYELSKQSGVPRSMIYEVVGKLVERGAAMILRTGGTTKYAPVSAVEFFNQLQREQEELISELKNDLSSLASAPDLEYVWNIEGHDNIIGRSIEMIEQAEERIYLTLLPVTLPDLESTLKAAVKRGVRVVIYTTGEIDLPGAQIAVVQVSEETLSHAQGLGLILVSDSKEVLIAEWLAGAQAHASWTSSPLLVFIAEHHLRTDLYLPQVLAMLGDQALDFIKEEDRELFARALESHT